MSRWRELTEIGARSRPPIRAEVGGRAEANNERLETNGEFRQAGNKGDENDAAMRWLYHLQLKSKGARGQRKRQGHGSDNAQKLAEFNQVQGTKPAVYT